MNPCSQGEFPLRYGYRPAQWSHVVPDDDSDAVEERGPEGKIRSFPMEVAMNNSRKPWENHRKTMGK